ncbi:hypothetical protein [Enterovirga rhinocerotis]|uniref:20S proteasome alpha/beta subunit n=1 Tax=Enterovirga rhinocerotis TaxID=1339210 RepID=A0A4R7CAI2_9HYPH|nr:hypothetical protein [Enterovirga rhinocerotis]TDR93807.1 hypothetical protein EV668_1074 [Enterovirga rhinocerotis]
MSAANIFLFSNAIVVWTDGALYRSDGTLSSVGPKVGLMPHLSAALVTRGPALAVPFLTHFLSVRFATFDELVAGFGKATRTAAEIYAEAFAICEHGADFEAYVAGWPKDRPEPEVYRVSSLDFDDVQKLRSVTVAPGRPDIIAQLEAEYGHLGHAGLSLPEVGLRLLELQRERIRREQVPGGPEICGIGGFAQVTTITRELAQTQILKRWPDRIGERMGQEYEAVPEGATLQ